ncbi:MAG: hypothetical protein LC105_05370 [Chitinophagales bacterium]|nr:hypothetical protein [Chitinophagales bacterium]MCZ2393264.1 hypothetical protein [Chitinophagales bacterium]
MKERDLDMDDLKGATAGLATVISWTFAHSAEIGFIVATGVSILTGVYLVQGIILRNRKLKNGGNS